MTPKEKETLASVYQDIATCKDIINDLCNKDYDQPDLKIGYELGSLHMIILRIFGDICDLK